MNPIDIFEEWYNAALENDMLTANMVALGTVCKKHLPHVRIVLFKKLKDGEFYFYTNYDSPKASDIKNNLRSAMTFHWPALERQVRVEGITSFADRKDSEEYWNSRPRGSQLSGTASPQGKEIESHEWLSLHKKEIEKKFEGRAIPCPENWGGIKIKPNLIEFWQGRPDRLHEREQYTLESGLWVKKFLGP